VALVGPNGAGKSTLIKTWVGLERPTRGHAAVLGVDTWHRRRQAVGHVAYVPQTPALYRQLSVAEHLDLARSMRAGFDRAYAASRLAELGVPITARAGELSGGQQAQLGLALALATRAPVLLLDEPLASLDPVARREFLQVLRDAVTTEGSTCILSSHLVTDIEEACDRLVVLAAGSKLLDEALSTALELHAVSADGVAVSKEGGATPVASFTGSDRSSRMLWRLVPGRLDPALRRASLDEVVVGYLTLARQSEGHR
jgi:ABC-2 type transport system ATP-binding protein